MRQKYIAGKAQLTFHPDFDWSADVAQKQYETAIHKFPCDCIHYKDCITSMRSLPDASVDVIIADPPFGINFSGKSSCYHRDADLVTDGYVEIIENYETFSEQWIAESPRLMKKTSSAYIISGWTHLESVLRAIRIANLTVINHIVWKYQFGVPTKHQFVSSHYHILFVVKDPKHYFFNRWEFYPEDVWIIAREYARGEEKNGTKLPNEVVTRMINFSSQPGDLIFDPFMGNATTAIVAKSMYRHFYGFELNTKSKSLHTTALSSVQCGDHYQSLADLQPSLEELLNKYPHLRKVIKKPERGLATYLE